MIKKMNYLLVLLISILSCNVEKNPKHFSDEALNDMFITLQGESITLQNILKKHKDKTILIDVWASWCRDCLEGLPKVKSLQSEYEDVAYVFLSLDRGEEAWERGIEKYQVEGEHYYMPNGKKCAFADFVKIDWIPRYMVINKAGKIELFKAIKADDNKLVNALKK